LTSFSGEHSTFQLLLTFGVTFLCLKIFFLENGCKPSEKVQKVQNETGKLADLVCTKGVAE